jgi:hypothetical protein
MRLNQDKQKVVRAKTTKILSSNYSYETLGAETKISSSTLHRFIHYHNNLRHPTFAKLVTFINTCESIYGKIIVTQADIYKPKPFITVDFVDKHNQTILRKKLNKLVYLDRAIILQVVKQRAGIDAATFRGFVKGSMNSSIHTQTKLKKFVDEYEKEFGEIIIKRPTSTPEIQTDNQPKQSDLPSINQPKETLPPIKFTLPESAPNYKPQEKADQLRYQLNEIINDHIIGLKLLAKEMDLNPDLLREFIMTETFSQEAVTKVQKWIDRRNSPKKSWFASIKNRMFNKEAAAKKIISEAEKQIAELQSKIEKQRAELKENSGNS